MLAEMPWRIRYLCEADKYDNMTLELQDAYTLLDQHAEAK